MSLTLKNVNVAGSIINPATEERLVNVYDKLVEVLEKLAAGLPAALVNSRLGTSANVQFDGGNVTAVNRLPVDVGANIQLGDVTVVFDNAVPDLSALLATPFGVSESRETAYYDLLAYAAFKAVVWADEASAVDGAEVIWSEDGVNALSPTPDKDTLPADTVVPFAVPRRARYAKFKYTNGTIAQTAVMRVGIIFTFQPLSGGHGPLGAPFTDLSTVTGVAAGTLGRHVSGAWVPDKTTASGEKYITSESIDSGEVEYTPGLSGGVATAVGDTVVYTAAAGKAFRIRSVQAIPALRGVEEAPVVTLKILNSDNSPYSTPMVGAVLAKRKRITGPLEGKIAINLDIASRVPYTLDIEEYTP